MHIFQYASMHKYALVSIFLDDPLCNKGRPRKLKCALVFLSVCWLVKLFKKHCYFLMLTFASICQRRFLHHILPFPSDTGKGSLPYLVAFLSDWKFLFVQYHYTFFQKTLGDSFWWNVRENWACLRRRSPFHRNFGTKWGRVFQVQTSNYVEFRVDWIHFVWR